MSDLISRQAAIEEIKRCESADSYDFNNGLIRAMNAIADIPSAQPRTKCIAEIKISKEDLDELVAEKVEEIKAAQPEQRWIPVTERLPEECGEYLVTKKEIGWNCEEYYRNDIAYWDTSFHKANEVIAWMPLPEPYKGEQP